jgi:hypothetical protein
MCSSILSYFLKKERLIVAKVNSFTIWCIVVAFFVFVVFKNVSEKTKKNTQVEVTHR